MSISYNLDYLLAAVEAENSGQDELPVATTKLTQAVTTVPGEEGSFSEDNASPTFSRPLVAFLLIVCCVGVIGNFLVIMVVLTLGEYRKAVTHWYVLQLAISDMLFLLTIPFKASNEINGTWIFPLWICKAKQTILYLNYYASIGFLVVMSIDRYIGVCHGFSDMLQKFRTPLAAYITTAVVWILSILLCIPEMIASVLSGSESNCECTLSLEPNDTIPTCSSTVESKESDPISADYGDYYDYYDDEDQSYQSGCHYINYPRFKGLIFFNFSAMFLIPFIVMTCCYSLIILRLRRSQLGRGSAQSANSVDEASTTTDGNNPTKCSKSAASKKDSRKRTRVTVMCASLVILFFVCWLPFHAVHLAKVNGIAEASSEYCKLLSKATVSLVFLNSALNPFLYNFIGTRFGQRLRSATSRIGQTMDKRSFESGHVRYSRRKRPSADTGGSSQTASATTKIAFMKRKSEGAVSVDRSAMSNKHSEEEQRLAEPDPKSLGPGMDNTLQIPK